MLRETFERRIAMTDTLTTPGEPNHPPKRQSRLIHATSIVRGWFRELLEEFRYASPGKQLAHTYYAGMVVIGIVGLPKAGSVVCAWAIPACDQAKYDTSRDVAAPSQRPRSPDDFDRKTDQVILDESRLREARAIEWLLNLLKQRPELREALETASNALYLGERSKSLVDTVKDVAKRPGASPQDAAQYHRQLAAFTFNYSKAEALKELYRATRLDPHNWAAWYDYGNVAFALGRLADAEHALHHVVQRAGDNALLQVRSRIRLGDVLVERGLPDQAFATYNQAEPLIDKELSRGTDNQAILLEKANLLTRRGELFRIQGKRDDAMQAFQKSLESLEKLASHPSTDSRRQRDLVGTHIRIGNILRSRGETEAAEGAYRKAFDIVQPLAVRDPADKALQQTLATTHDRLGTIAHVRHDWVGALMEFEQALAISKDLVKVDRQNMEWQRDLMAAYRRVGDTQRNFGKLDEAAYSYRAAHAVIEDVAQQGQLNPRWEKDRASCLVRIGDILLQGKDTDKALEKYRLASAILARITNINGLKTHWEDDRGRVEGKIADLLLDKKERIEARKAAQRALDIAKDLYRRDTLNVVWQHDLIVALNRQGDILHDEGNRDRAIAHYREAAANAHKLIANKHPAHQWSIDLIETLRRLIDSDVERPQNLDAIVSALEDLEKTAPLTLEYQLMLNKYREQLTALKHSV